MTETRPRANDAVGEPDVAAEEASTAIRLDSPAGGVPAIIDSPEALADAVAAFAAGHGPVAADAERASGFRYGQATYLVQFKRAGAGLILVDTAALPDLSAFGAAVGDAEFVFHAASQDLPGMHDLGLRPSSIFDTELAARLLGWSKVGLAAVIERELGFALAKEHSAQDWSVRPLPAGWLAYAALDVELLLELRDALAAHLEDQGKAEWAKQEFEAARLAPPAEPRIDPWRRVGGTHLVRDTRGLAIVKALWEDREKEAQRRDVTPGRVLRDAAIVAAAKAKPSSLEQLTDIAEWRSRGTKRAASRWWPTIAAALELPESALPARRAPAGDGPPPVRAWSEKRPEAAARLEATRTALAELATTHDIPVENLMQPDAVRRACWEYKEGGAEWLGPFLERRGAREWQRELVIPVLERAFLAAALAPVPPPVAPNSTDDDETDL